VCEDLITVPPESVEHDRVFEADRFHVAPAPKVVDVADQEALDCDQLIGSALRPLYEQPTSFRLQLEGDQAVRAGEQGTVGL
jgi:hypothetical protein